MIANGVAIVLKVSLWSIALSECNSSRQGKIQGYEEGGQTLSRWFKSISRADFDFLKSFLNFGFCGFDFIEMLTMELSGVDF